MSASLHGVFECLERRKRLIFSAGCEGLLETKFGGGVQASFVVVQQAVLVLVRSPGRVGKHLLFLQIPDVVSTTRATSFRRVMQPPLSHTRARTNLLEHIAYHRMP